MLLIIGLNFDGLSIDDLKKLFDNRNDVETVV